MPMSHTKICERTDAETVYHWIMTGCGILSKVVCMERPDDVIHKRRLRGEIGDI